VKKLWGIKLMANKTNFSNLLSKVARGKCRKRQTILLEASAKYMGVTKPKKRF
jgi:hypothetical protein